MRYIRHIILSAFVFACLNTNAQKKDTAYVNKLLQEIRSLLGADSAKAVLLSQQVIDVSREIGYKKGEATALKNIGIVNYLRQHYLETLHYWDQSLRIFEAADDKIGVANLLNNIAAVYKDRGEDSLALDYALRSLKIAEQTGDTLRIISSLTTTASIYHNKKDPKALDYLLRARNLSGPSSLGIIDGNIGEIQFDLGEAASGPEAEKYYNEALKYYHQSIQADSKAVSAAFGYNGIGKVYHRLQKNDLAISNHRQALLIAQILGDKWNMFKAYQGMANAYMKQGDNNRALANFTQALPLAEEIENNDVADLYRDMSIAYAGAGDSKNALEYQKKYTEKIQQIYNAEVEKQMGRLKLNQDLGAKEEEVNALAAEKKIQEQAKIGFAIGLGLILIIAVILFRNYRVKVKTNKILDRQKDEIEGLLLNILPAEVAKELQSTGASVPKHHSDVAVLFTDFKGFTAIADRMSPSDLVTQLNECFIEFDNIVEKYGLEKIKTIGDAYMCAAGIPSKGEKNTYRIVKAAVEIQEWVKANNEKRMASGFEPWDIRIGVHTGPLVAGVVGKKKYAYDIWGTTVNIASRMESNGEPGKVNISSASYELVRSDFNCSHRGKIHAKNIGDIDMYFVESEIDRSYRLVGADNITEITGTTLN
jgi:adenylate cyclase